MAGAMGVPFLGRVPLDLAVNRAGDAGVPFLTGDVAGPTRDAFEAIIAKLPQ